MLADRIKLYKKIEAARKSKLIAFATGDRPGRETQIAPDAVDLLGTILDGFDGKKISLLLYTRGGNTSAACSLVNLIREFTDDLEVLVPSKCQSAGTLICLGANTIVMSKQATLGPIDPSVTTPMNPQIPGSPQRTLLPLSVEDVAGYMTLAREEGGLKGASLAEVFVRLATEVHPIALGSVKRARGQIQDLARKLLSIHMKDERKRNKIIKVLCNDAGSHDYAIYRHEARSDLGLPIETPSMPVYELMRDAVNDVRAEMEIEKPFNPGQLVTPNTPGPVEYKHVRAVIETSAGSSYHYITNGRLIGVNVPMPPPQPATFGIRDETISDGWEKVA